MAIGVWAFTVGLLPAAEQPRQQVKTNDLRVGVAGSEPFVVKSAGRLEGISVEIWQALAAESVWRYTLQPFENVPHALDALAAGRG